ncbi:hypothetical protein TanjilG_23190 [Lupinus angustifolius]|uniref:VQ domain-containing protein n=1 Tax=Lupinus angustifolius TaxID=3871 RepID=A0A394DCP2_LUPAN|nr:PREDICTED: VQ motif-containing protein 1-like [Lupinus angustifolius]OIW20809.1 hypothetical protein TanjilG_23190 [Lupinus angustifolius]
MKTSTGLRGEAPKVVQIETRYVQTDAINFKEVVQSFTGKNSSTAWIGQKNDADQSYDVVVARNSEIKGGTSVTVAKPEDGAASMLMNNISFKDFDNLFLELPPMDIEARPWF